jgi:hypothetical protein
MTKLHQKISGCFRSMEAVVKATTTGKMEY